MNNELDKIYKSILQKFTADDSVKLHMDLMKNLQEAGIDISDATLYTYPTGTSADSPWKISIIPFSDNMPEPIIYGAYTLSDLINKIPDTVYIRDYLVQPDYIYKLSKSELIAGHYDSLKKERKDIPKSCLLMMAAYCAVMEIAISPIKNQLIKLKDNQKIDNNFSDSSLNYI